MNCRRSCWALLLGASLGLGAGRAAADAPVEAAGEPGKDENAQAGYIPGYRRATALGLSPQAPQVPALPGASTVPFSAPEPVDGWNFNFRGYMSVALRASRGSRENPTSDQYSTTFHALPRIPDTYGTFSGTNATTGSWVDLTFEYGNSLVTSHVKVTSWKPNRATDWTAVGSQNFIDEAYLTFKPPPVGKLNLNLTVGAFRNVYGGLGQYGVGQYNAQIIGMPFGVGETLSGQYDLGSAYTLFLEHGVMGRLAKSPVGQVPFIGNSGSNPSVPSSWVHHAHAGLSRGGDLPLVLGIHYLRNWTQDERDQNDDPRTVWIDESRRPDAHMSIYGADFRMLDNYLGNFAIAASYADARYAQLLTGLNYFGSYSGEQATKRFFGPQAGGTAKMFVTGFEYFLSWGRLLRHPTPFGGDGPDLTTSFFANYGSIASQDPDADGRHLYKFGTEITYRFFSWMSVSGRADHVVPNTKDAKETFNVVSPKLIFKSNWLSHEQVTLSYTRWFYGEHTHAEFPDDYTHGQLDNEMFALSFGMWW